MLARLGHTGIVALVGVEEQEDTDGVVLRLEYLPRDLWNFVEVQGEKRLSFE